MNLTLELKEELLQKCIQELQEKLQLCKNSLNDISEGIHNETKSSAGDKFETGREIMQQERQKTEVQIQRISSNLETLNGISGKITTKVETGAWIKSGSNYLFFIPGFSSLDFQTQKIFTAALGSPIGQALKGLKKEESVTFRNKKYTIDQIV